MPFPEPVSSVNLQELPISTNNLLVRLSCRNPRVGCLSPEVHLLSILSSTVHIFTLSPEMRVTCERLENASVTTRVAGTFIRIGNFEALSCAMFFFGGGQWHNA
ncbi:hypothetical protein BKA83DRAFT_4333840 [Pisolithus microcarpus]|nr:hypothetical protein BKA83DRAFT_4333840 [Pisolithus microcarpus]